MGVVGWKIRLLFGKHTIEDLYRPVEYLDIGCFVTLEFVEFPDSVGSSAGLINRGSEDTGTSFEHCGNLLEDIQIPQGVGEVVFPDKFTWHDLNPRRSSLEEANIFGTGWCALCIVSCQQKSGSVIDGANGLDGDVFWHHVIRGQAEA